MVSLFSANSLFLSDSHNNVPQEAQQIEYRDHGFSCINIGRVPRKVFEHEPAGRVFKHLPRDPAYVNARQNMVDRYSCINL